MSPRPWPPLRAIAALITASVLCLAMASCGSQAPPEQPAVEVTDAPTSTTAEPPVDEPAGTESPATTDAAGPAPSAADLRAAPAVSFDYFDGANGSLADFAGSPTVVNFWASWCPPCIVEMPAFEAVHRELAPNVAFLGINVGDEPGAASELAATTGVTYPLAADPDSSIFAAFGGFGMPTTALLDADGNIVHMVSARLRAQDLRALISEHLGI